MSDSKYDEKTLRDLLDEAVSREEKRTPLQRAMDRFDRQVSVAYGLLSEENKLTIDEVRNLALNEAKVPRELVQPLFDKIEQLEKRLSCLSTAAVETVDEV